MKEEKRRNKKTVVRGIQYIFAATLIIEIFLLAFLSLRGGLVPFLEAYGVGHLLGSIFGEIIVSTGLGLIIYLVYRRIVKAELQGWKIMIFGLAGYGVYLLFHLI